MAYASMGPIEKREQYERIHSVLWMEKTTFDSQWKDLADFVKPRRLRQYVQDRNKGDRRNMKIIDSAGTFALRTYHNGLLIGMTPPSDYWFKLTTPDPELSRFEPVKEWLWQVSEILHALFAMTNLYAEMPLIYADHGLFGTAAAGCFEDDEDPFRLYPYPIGTYTLGASKRGVVDTFIREYSMSVRNLIDEFGERTASGQPDWSRFSETVKSLYEKGQYEEQVEVCWIVAPNMDYRPGAIEAKYKRWISCYFEKGRQGDDAKTGLLRESGFDQFPILAPRFEPEAEGVFSVDSCGMTAIGDIRQLQTMQKRKAQAVEKMVNPPVQAPTHLRSIGVNLLPGGVNYTDQIQQQVGIRSVHDVNMQIDHMRQDIEDVRFLIRRAFYEDLFLMIAMTDRRQITAREIDERHEEKILSIGAIIERLFREGPAKVIDRAFELGIQKGWFPEAPADLEGVGLKIESISILSKLQKLVRAVPLERFMGNMVNLAQDGLFPQVRHKIKVFEMVDRFADATGVDPEMIASNDEAEASLQAEQEAVQRQMQAEQAAAQAKAARDLSQSPLDTDNALSRMVSA